MVFEPVKLIDVEVPEISFAEWLLQNCRKRASEGKTALVWADNGTHISYADLLRDAVRVATGLQAMGVKSGDTMGFVTRNSPELFPFVVGCIFADIIIAPSIAELSADELRSNFEITRPRYILTRPEKATQVQEAIADFNPRPNIILLKEKSFNEILTKGSHAHPDTFKPVKVENPFQHVFAYMFSSGTTGKQKAISLIDYYFLNSTLLGLAPILKNDGLLFVISQINWVSWIFTLFRTVISGRPWLFATNCDLDSILGYIHKYKPTTYVSFPHAINAICNAVEQHPAGRWDLSSLKLLLTAGDRLGAREQKDLSERLKIPIYQEYGCTELGYVTAADLDHEPVHGSAGKIVSAIKLVNPDTEEEITRRYEMGEIRVKTASMNIYLRNPQGTAEAFDKEGWYRMGDLGYLDEDNNLFIVNRIKETLKYKGYQVTPSEIEEILRVMPGVADAAVAGKFDITAGSLITAFVIKKPGANITESDVNNFLAKGNLHDAKKLRGGVIFVDELPKNANGKLLRRKLADLLNGTQE